METTKNKSVVCSNCGGQIDINTLEESVECPFCGTKYAVSDLLNESDAVRIEKIKTNAQQKMEKEKLEHEKERNKSQEEKDDAEKFKKGKFSKIMIICAILDVLFCAVSFNDGKILAGILAAAMAGLLIWAYLMRAHIVKEAKKGMGTIIAIVALVLFIPFMSLRNMDTSYKSQEEKASQLDISNAELIAEFPMPDKLYGVLKYDRKDLLEIEIADVQKQDYKNYVKKCVEKGYVIDVDESDNVYDAFSESGYNIRVHFEDYSYKDKKTLDITLRAPEEMNEFEWPTNGLGTKVPQAKSNYGRISWNNSDSFIVHVGKTTKAEYNEYVKECENNGYTLDYSKGDKSYRANNEEGYRLSLMYLGGDRMEISVKPPEGTSNKSETTKNVEQPKTETPTQTEEPKKETTKPSENTSSSHTGLSKEFKEAMDSYEAFIDEYCTFMKKYAKSNGTDMTLISDYAKYASKLADAEKKFDKWEEEEMNDEETAYYIQVQTRVNQKLLEVASY